MNHVRSGRSSTFPAPARNSLVGRMISVPYSLIIEDDYSGCTCECNVLERSTRGYLVTLAGEQLWKPESFIRRWLSSSQQAGKAVSSLTTPPPAEADALNELLATCDLSSSIPTVPLTGNQTEVLNYVPTSLVPLYGDVNPAWLPPRAGTMSSGRGTMQLDARAVDLMQNEDL